MTTSHEDAPRQAARGNKYMAVGFLIAIAGAFVAFSSEWLGVPQIFIVGWVIGVIGVFVGAYGIIWIQTHHETK